MGETIKINENELKQMPPAGGDSNPFGAIINILGSSILGNLLKTGSGEPEAQFHTTLTLDKIEEWCKHDSNINPTTLLMHLTTINKVVVQEVPELDDFRVVELLHYPDLRKEGWLISNPKLTEEGIIFDINQELPEDKELDLIACNIRDEADDKYLGSLIKVVVVNKK